MFSVGKLEMVQNTLIKDSVLNVFIYGNAGCFSQTYRALSKQRLPEPTQLSASLKSCAMILKLGVKVSFFLSFYF